MSEQFLSIGLDISESLIKSALTDARGVILEIEQRETPVEDASGLQQATLAAVLDLQQKALLRQARVLAVGLGVAGVVNPGDGRIESASDLRLLEKVDLSGALSMETELAVVCEHRAKMAAYGEHICGAAKGLANSMYIHLGSSIVAGIILGGEIYRGSLGYAGELGHMTVDPDGLECSCGNTGCLETIASGPNLVRRTRERLFRDRSSSLSSLASPGKGDLTPQRIAMEALDGDDFSIMMLEQTGRWIGVAIASVVNLLNLDMVILDGGMMVAGDLLLGPMIQWVRERTLETPGRHCRIETSNLGGQSGVIGAAMLARESVGEHKTT